MRTLNVTPPGGWRFTDPETGHEMYMSTWENLLNQAANHRVYKNLPLEDLDNLIQDQICAKLDPKWWYEVKDEK